MSDEPEQPALRCLVCGEDVATWYGQEAGAVEFRGRPCYGSRHDSSLAGTESLAVYVHDDCLPSVQERILLLRGSPPCLPTATRHVWTTEYDALHNRASENRHIVEAEGDIQ